uniref:Uncharacterized protein LOC109679185 n=1 Tax=Castor canadensis TaxID=51338 RepID=A0A8B7TQR3_CASCN|nr:uncharacterized protein LOC109679185 [Castor canadensis]
MAALMRGKDSSRCLLLLAAVLMVESSQLGSSRAKLNSIKSSLGGETPAQAANRSAGIYQGLAFSGSKKGKNLGQVGTPFPLLPNTLFSQESQGPALLARAVCHCAWQHSTRAARCDALCGWGAVSRSWVCMGAGLWVVAGSCAAWSGRARVLFHLCFGTWARIKI